MLCGKLLATAGLKYKLALFLEIGKYEKCLIGKLVRRNNSRCLEQFGMMRGRNKTGMGSKEGKPMKTVYRESFVWSEWVCLEFMIISS